MENKWQKSGNKFYNGDTSDQKDLLDSGIYSLERDPATGVLYLEKLYEQFNFDYKMYGIQSKFIDRVVTTYNNTKGNLGILLNGIKGTGKSVTAKVLSNKFDLPVVLINKNYPGIPDFINSIQQDIVVFIDEFEKIFDERDGSVLTVMDGTLDNGFRRTFLLTTNNLRVNENLIQRPGRVRYLKTFYDLDREIIEMIVDDCLKYPELREDTVSFISRLELITVDIVKAVVAEVNIHRESPEEFKDVFNVKERELKTNIYHIKDDGSETLMRRADGHIYDRVFNTSETSGPYINEYIPGFGETDFHQIVNAEQGLVKVILSRFEEGYDENNPKYTTIKLEKVISLHKSYAY